MAEEFWLTAHDHMQPQRMPDVEIINISTRHMGVNTHTVTAIFTKFGNVSLGLDCLNVTDRQTDGQTALA